MTQCKRGAGCPVHTGAATETKTPVEMAAEELDLADTQLHAARSSLVKQVQLAAVNGTSVATLARQAGVQRSTIYAWLHERPT